MKTLAFDSSNKGLAVALLDGEDLVANLNLLIGQPHSTTLMPSVDFLMAQAGWLPTDLELVAVAQGPGSYTGLRMAASLAKTLAYTLKLPLAGVSSLYALVQSSGLVVPLINARRGFVYGGIYENREAVLADQYIAFSDLLVKVEGYEKVTFTGEVADFVSQISEKLPKAEILLDSQPSALAIGRLGQTLPKLTGQKIHDFVPNYLKRVEAEERWIEQHEDDAQEDRNYVSRD